MKRTFIAVKTKADKKLIEAASLLHLELKKELIKWVDMNQIHITLAFLGDTDDDIIEKVSSMLSENCENSGMISFTISGLGVFRDINNPRVIWAGIKNYESLSKLQQLVTRCLINIGITPEEREFKPHITLGRIKYIKDRNKLKQIISKYDNIEFQEVKIEELIYYESVLKPEGPIYLPIKQIPL
ncbi:MAG TPA: RNA 2',3'-cyclic phosphodiesterase [Bacteroidales bacterium]|nr:RNA 2',3'-cyclic phosphodiesterase [Bacteroidales bacterium]HQG53850.1 RNA 2',3'-cyclic phosphodiesterase [Bacteroidales bacterium]